MFKHVVCGECGVDFGITDSFYLLVTKGKLKIFCPRGHSLGGKPMETQKSNPSVNLPPSMPDTRNYLDVIGNKDSENHR